MRSLFVALMAGITFVAVSGAVSARSEYDTIRQSLRVPVMVEGAWVLPQPSSSGRRTPFSGSGYSGMIAEACAQFGCDPSYLESVMACESGGDPYATAYNPQSGNLTVGLFQIDEMWGVGYDPAAQIWFAAEHLTAGDIYWVCG